MSVLSREDFANRIKAIVGDNTDDESISFLEDMEDTYADLETRANGDGVDWKAKYEENDAEWRSKYKERFFNGSKEDDDNEDEEDGKETKTKFEDLFEVKEG